MRRDNWPQIGLVVASALLLAVSFVGMPYPRDQPLHHVPTVLGLFALVWCARHGLLSNASMLAINAFIWLHILGARYIYSFVPYDDWCSRWLGCSLSEMLGSERNHYDRLVHFAYGALATIPQVEVLTRRLRLSTFVAHLFSFALVLAAGATYEIFEWLLAIVMAPEWAERYNGQQGDVWDAQKDMALAAAGAVTSSLCMLAKSSIEKRNP